MNIIIISLAILNIILALCFVGLRFIYRLEVPQTFFTYMVSFLSIGLPGITALILTILRMKGYGINIWHIILATIITGTLCFFYLQ